MARAMWASVAQYETLLLIKLLFFVFVPSVSTGLFSMIDLDHLKAIVEIKLQHDANNACTCIKLCKLVTVIFEKIQVMRSIYQPEK
ncbi:hypothetical protein VIBNIAM115_1680026 [Vibrio nigripulchritudo AM115]|nr:hypothetical protein VIBNIAM115_1680026 [Vibrio nigripulchritudo AM115]